MMRKKPGDGFRWDGWCKQGPVSAECLSRCWWTGGETGRSSEEGSMTEQLVKSSDATMFVILGSKWPKLPYNSHLQAIVCPETPPWASWFHVDGCGQLHILDVALFQTNLVGKDVDAGVQFTLRCCWQRLFVCMLPVRCGWLIIAVTFMTIPLLCNGKWMSTVSGADLYMIKVTAF